MKLLCKPALKNSDADSVIWRTLQPLQCLGPVYCEKRSSWKNTFCYTPKQSRNKNAGKTQNQWKLYRQSSPFWGRKILCEQYGCFKNIIIFCRLGAAPAIIERCPTPFSWSDLPLHFQESLQMVWQKRALHDPDCRTHWEVFSGLNSKISKLIAHSPV